MSNQGQITRVQVNNAEGEIRVDVRLSPSNEYEEIPFRKPAKGVWFIPEVGDVVEVTEVEGRGMVAHSPAQPPAFPIPDSAEQGDVIIKTSSGVVKIYSNGGIDLETGDGYIYINQDGSIEASDTI